MALNIQKLIIKLKENGTFVTTTNTLPDWEALQSNGAVHEGSDHQQSQDALGDKINEIIDALNDGEIRQLVGEDGIFITSNEENQVVIGLSANIQDSQEDAVWYKLSDLKFDGQGDTTIASKVSVDKAIAEAISSATTIKGTVWVKTKAEIELVIADYNAGVPLTFSDGTTYSRGADAKVGDVVVISQAPFTATEVVKTEQALVDDSLLMTLLTNNNEDDARLTAVEVKNVDQDIQIAGINTVLAEKIGVDKSDMPSSYTPALPNDVAINSQVEALDGDIKDVHGDGTYDTNTTLTTRANSSDARITAVEDTITGGVDFDLADAKLTWSGLVKGSGTTSEVSFDLPVSANSLSDGKLFDYTDGQTLEIGVADSPETTAHVTTASFTIGQPLEENMYFKDSEIAVVGMVSAASPGKLILTSVGNGNKDITDTLRLVKVNQIIVTPLTSLAAKQDVVDLENSTLTALETKQNKTDSALNTVNKTVVGGINENKVVSDSNTARIDNVVKDVDINSNYNSIFDINVNNKLSIGLTEDSMFKELLAEYESGRLTIGSAVAMQMRNNNTLHNAVEVCHDAEVKEIELTNGAGSRYFVIAVDKHVDTDGLVTKGMVTIIEGILDDATYTQQDVYSFTSEHKAKTIDCTDLTTYSQIYFGYGTRFTAGDRIKMISGKTGDDDNKFIYVTVGAKQDGTGPVGSGDFSVSGIFHLEDGQSLRDLYLTFPSSASTATITYDAWDEMVVSSSGFNIGDFKWSYNGTQTGWSIANGASTSGMSQEVIDVFGSNLPNLITDGKFIRASNVAGTLQSDATAANGLSSATARADLHEIYTSSTGTTHYDFALYRGVKNLGIGDNSGIIDQSGYISNIMFTGESTVRSYGSRSTLPHGAGHTHSISSVDNETRPINISMIPLIYTGV